MSTPIWVIIVMIRYKVDILNELKKAGYTSYRLRQEILISESTLQRLRQGGTGIRLDSLDAICRLLDCQPGDLIEWVPEDEE